MALTKLPKNAFGTGSVDDSKIEDGTIQNQEISGTLPEEKLATGTIENASLSNSTITINGTSISLGGSSSVGVDVNWQSVITGAGSSSTAVAGNGYFIDTTSDTHTLNLPASASLGDQIAIKDYAGTFGSNNLTIGRNGHNIQGAANDSLISTNRASIVLVYVDSTKGWLYAEESNVASLEQIQYISATGGTIATSGDYKIHTFTGDGCFVVSEVGNSVGSTTVDYLVIAGGGGGGIASSGVPGGGGGAGGYRESFPNPATGGFPVSTTTYPITVGGGGSGGPGSSSNGSNSVFSTITSAGGGKGAVGFVGLCGVNGNNGGSGGGGGVASQNGGTNGLGGSGNTPPVSPPQGNPGGGAFSFQGHSFGSGAGGGAGCAGAGGGPGAGGDGGDGITSSINGTPTTRAGGGGGGGRQPLYGVGVKGDGGAGGGADGGQANLDASSGPANFGGGGGGEASGSGFGGAGGKGIVIIRYKFQ